MEKVTLETVKRSKHDITIFTFAYDEENTFEEFKDLGIQVIKDYGVPTSFVTQALNFGLRPVMKKIDIEDYDLLLVSEAGFGSPILSRNHDKPVLGYCHTLLRATLPEFRDTYRKGFPKPLRPLYPLMAASFNFIEGFTWIHYDFVYTNSDLTRNRVLQKNLVKKESIEVLNPGVEIQNIQEEHEKYFLYPSRFERYKRQDLAIEAFKKADLEDFKLVLAGSSADKQYVEELREKSGENIEIEIDVSGERWHELNKNCYAALFLPKREDFGLVPIEVGGYSKPVIAADEGNVSETVNDKETGFLVKPEAEQIAEKMRYMVENPEKVEQMGEKSLENSKKYSWKNFIETLDSKIEELAER